MTAALRGRSRSLLTVVDLTATFVFAMEGAIAYLHAGRAAAMTAGFAVCLVVRLVSVWQGWSLPHLD